MKYDYPDVKNIFIICGKTDMRKGIDGLATLVQDSLELDPYGDSIFLFAGWKKIVISACILTEMASPCFISALIMENFNGQKMNRRYAIYLDRNLGSYSRDYHSNSLRPFSHHQKVCPTLVKNDSGRM